MKYASAYRVKENNDMGYCDRSSYIVVNSVGYYEFDEPCGPTHRKNGRYDYYLSYNCKGSMHIKVDHKDYFIGEGTVFIYKPFEEQYYGQANQERISNYWVHFTGYGAAELLAKAKLSEGHIFNIGIHEDIIDVFEQLITEMTNKKPAFELLSSSLLIHLVSLIARKLETITIIDQNVGAERIYKTVEYIYKNYNKKITVSELATIANLSVSRYSSLFKKVIGVSPQQYIIHYRLEKACELMQHTKLNIKQIAIITGFDDQLYFSRLFKKYYKINPSQYMKQINS